MKMMNEIRVIEDGAVETIRRMIEGDQQAMKVKIKYRDNKEVNIDEVKDVVFCEYDIEIYFLESEEVTVIDNYRIKSVEISGF